MQRNILLGYVLTSLRYSWFWVGVWIFYYLRFTNYSGIGFIETVQIIAITLSEVPTGFVADVFGKKNTLTIAFILQTIGMSLLAFAPQTSFLVIGVLIAGMGGSFYSGTMDALMYDTLKEKGEEHVFDKVISKVTSISLIAPSALGIIGGFLYTVRPNLPFILNAACYGVAIPLTFFLIEPHVKDKADFSLGNFVAQTKASFGELFKSNFVTKQTLLLVSTGIISVICVEMLNDFLGVEFGFKPTQLAILWSVLYFICAFASHMTPYIAKFFSYKWTAVLIGFVLALTLVVSPLAGMGGLLLGGITLLIRSSFQAMFNNVSSVLINKTTESKYRVTTLSTFNLLKNIPYVFTAYFLGLLADRFSAITIAFYLGIILFLFILFQTIFFVGKDSDNVVSAVVTE